VFLRRIRDGLLWRWQLTPHKRYLRRQFRNGAELIQSFFTKESCQTAVLRDGTLIRHPARSGLAQTILEIWFEQAYTRGFYRPQTGDTIIDAGANVGLFSIWIARTCPGCRVFAFEPFQENYRLLEANLAAARTSEVTALPLGLAGSIGVAMMRDGGVRSLDHRLEFVPDAATYDLDVRTISFAEAVRLAGGAVALFKCDIEGSEYELFKHATPDDLRAVSRFSIEYHDNLCPGTLDLLRRRLAATHDLITRPASDSEYGMLYATRKSPA
jgi:FkbM family methyltransferase